MAGKTNIEWAEQSWNAVAGCTVLTPGCKRCYAMKMAARLAAMGQPLYAGLTKQSKAGPVWTGVMRQAPEHVLLAPLKRKVPTIYFVNSMSDLFHEDVPDEWIDAIFAVMALSPQHTFQVLTKRAERMRSYLVSEMAQARIAASAMAVAPKGLDIGKAGLIWAPRETPNNYFEKWPLSNVWLGVSTERQQEADERIPLLLQTPAAVRFISAEPLLGPIELYSLGGRAWETDKTALVTDALAGFRSDQIRTARLDWVIVGGESGHGARPMDIEWARSLKDQCDIGNVKFFMKQLSGPHGRAVKDMALFPDDLRVREMPA